MPIIKAWVWQASREYALVVVDEVGTRLWDSDREYTAIKRMADLREHRPAVWISNLEPEAIAKTYDPRIYSRICCGTVVETTEADRRFE